MAAGAGEEERQELRKRQRDSVRSGLLLDADADTDAGMPVEAPRLTTDGRADLATEGHRQADGLALGFRVRHAPRL